MISSHADTLTGCPLEPSTSSSFERIDAWFVVIRPVCYEKFGWGWAWPFRSRWRFFLSYVWGIHVVVFTRSSSVARALASTPICCSILQYTQRTKPSADAWAIDPWVCVVPSFLCASLFQILCVRVGDDVLLAATWNILVIFTKYRMPLLGSCSCSPSMPPEPSDARMPSLILWLSPTGYCSRDRQKSLFVLEYTSSQSCIVFPAIIIDRGFHRNSSLRAAWDTSILYEAKLECGVVYCTTSSYWPWGACWSKVLVLISM